MEVDGLTALEPAVFLARQGCSRQIKQCAISLLISSAQLSLRAERADILHLQLLVGAFAACSAEGFCALHPCKLWVALKNTNVTETERLSARAESNAADLSWFSDYS